MTIRTSVDLEGVKPKNVFDQFVVDLSDSLRREGIKFQAGANGEFLEESVRFGRVTKWRPPYEIEIAWNTSAKWDPTNVTKLNIKLEAFDSPDTKTGTRVTVENKGWGGLVGDRGLMLSEWFEDQIVTNLIKATSPNQFTDWLTDRRARKPSGAAARSSYRDPLFHRPGFMAVLHYLDLNHEDYLLDVGCGGGALLFDALKTGCKAAGIDHSPDMVRVARDLNAKSISEKRLGIVQSEANSIPYPDETFSCAVSANVFGFIDDPIAFLSEICRVLKSGGRLVLTTGSRESKGTISSPYPIASILHFYTEEELAELAKKSGFNQSKVERPNMEPFAREAGLPQDMIEFFSGQGGLFLLASKK